MIVFANFISFLGLLQENSKQAFIGVFKFDYQFRSSEQKYSKSEESFYGQCV